MNEQNTNKRLSANVNAEIASGILEGIIEEHPQTAEGDVNLRDAEICMEEVRTITADTAAEIEIAVNDLHDLEALLIVMQQAYICGEPDPGATAGALNSVSTSLMKIRESLDAVMDQIYGKGKE